jgi:hypothetical protein
VTFLQSFQFLSASLDYVLNRGSSYVVNFIKVFFVVLSQVRYSFSCLVRLLAWLLVVNYFCFFIVAACLFTLCSTLFHSFMEPDNTPNNLMIPGKIMLLQIGLPMSIWYSGYVHFNK